MSAPNYIVKKANNFYKLENRTRELIGDNTQFYPLKSKSPQLGDIVHIRDYSSNMGVSQGNLEPVWRDDVGKNTDWLVLATNCNLPADQISNLIDEYYSTGNNDLILRHLNSERIAFWCSDYVEVIRSATVREIKGE